MASTSSAVCSDAESNDTDVKASTIASAHNEEAWTDVNLNEDSQSNNEDDGRIHRGKLFLSTFKNIKNLAAQYDKQINTLYIQVTFLCVILLLFIKRIFIF